jgi:hypothetical protein
VDRADFRAFCESQGWRWVEGHPGDEETPEEDVWLADSNVEVHWMLDPAIHAAYILLSGENIFQTDMTIRLAFDFWTPEEATSVFMDSTEWDDRVLALSLVAATAGDSFNQATFDAIVAALSDDNETVRLKGAATCFYARWPELLPALTERADRDPDEQVRQVAALAADTINEDLGKR